MKVVVVIPTYNEKENITKLVPILNDVFNQMQTHECVALIVDGNSPDGTGELVTKLSDHNKFLQLLPEKEKNGLGAAYMYGFKHAISKLNADVIIEMDGDLQHDPKNIIDMVKAIEDGADYVIGSRFVKGGSIPEHWETYRKFLSWGGNLFSKFVLGMFHVNDFTSGYKASRVKGYVDSLDLDDVRSQGFAYKIDLLYKMHKAGATFKEIPIVFGLRDRGSSKMERNNAVDSLKVVVSIRYGESKSFFRFLAVGVAGLVTDLGSFNLLRLMIFTSRGASAFSGFLAMLVTFTLNNVWSFSHNKKTSLWGILKVLPIYFTISYLPIVFRTFLVDYASRTYNDNFYIVNGAFFIGVFFGIIWNYTIYSKIIWRKKPKQVN